MSVAKAAKFLIVAMAAVTPALAQQDRVTLLPEHRAIANAALILKMAAGVTTSGLFVNSPDEATLTGGGPPMVITRSDPCIYEITPQRGGGSVRIDFSKLSQQYAVNCRGYCHLDVYGAPGAVCYPATATRAAWCMDNLQMMGGTAQDLASIRFIQESSDSCSPFQFEPVQPRF